MRPTVIIGRRNWGHDTCKVQVCASHLNHKKKLKGAYSHFRDAVCISTYMDILTETMEVSILTLFSVLLCCHTCHVCSFAYVCRLHGCLNV